MPTTHMTLAEAIALGNETLLSPAETAAVLRTSPRTLEHWRSVGNGPRATRVGPRRVTYRVADVLAFLQPA